MAKKKRKSKKISVEEKKITEEKSPLLKDDPQELEPLKDYQPLNLSWKWHITVIGIITVIVLILYITYIQLITYYSNKKAFLGKAFIEIGQKLAETDTEPLTALMESPEYETLNQIQYNVSKIIESFRDIKIAKVINEEQLGYMNKFIDLYKKYKEICAVQKKKINNPSISEFLDDSLLEYQDANKLLTSIKEIKDVKKDIKKIDRLIMNVKDKLFQTEKNAVTVKGFWNYESAYAAAIEQFHDAITLNHRCDNAFYYLGKYYEMKKEYDLSGQRYVMVIKINPDSKHSKELFEKFKKEAAADPEDKQKLYNLAMAYMYRGNKSKAKEYFRKIIDKDKELKSFTAFMANKRFNDIDSDRPEVVFDPRW